jgi:hypothetical protein
MNLYDEYLNILSYLYLNMTPVSDSEILKEAQSAAEEKLLSQLSTPTPTSTQTQTPKSGSISVIGFSTNPTTSPEKKGESNDPKKEQMRESPDVDNVEKILNQLRVALKDY